MKQLLIILSIVPSLLFGQEDMKGLNFRLETNFGVEGLFAQGRNTYLQTRDVNNTTSLVRDTNYFTVGATVSGTVYPIYTKFFSYGFKGEINRGWFINNSSKYHYYGHVLRFGTPKYGLRYEYLIGEEEFARYSVEYNDRDYVEENLGKTNFFNIYCTYIAGQLAVKSAQLEAGVIVKKIKWRNDPVIGGRVKFLNKKGYSFDLLVLPYHPRWGWIYTNDPYNVNSLRKQGTYISFKFTKQLGFNSSYRSLFKK